MNVTQVIVHCSQATLFNAYGSAIFTRDFQPLKNNPDIRRARKVRGGEKKPEGKKAENGGLGR